MLAVFWARDELDRFVEGDEDAASSDGEAEEIGIGDLLMSEDAVAKGRGQVGPSGGDGPVAIAGVVGELSKNEGRIWDCVKSHFRICCDAKKAGLRECTHTPIEIWGLKPIHYELVMRVFGLTESYEHVHVEQVLRLIQGRLLRGLL